ncbi:MAG: maleylpyruvate isomerase family mycothiol-dependent enzyme [Marmoricola sp.]
MTHSDDLERLGESTQRLLHTVASISGPEWTAPSVLPGWSRAHVVAHLALNAEGMAGAVAAVLHGGSSPLYTSNEDRDGDVEKLSGEPSAVVGERLERASGRLGTALSALTPDLMDAEIERTPGGPRFPVQGLARTRRREVEVHHADLGLGYTHGDWPTDFAIELIERVAHDRAGQGPLTLRASDAGRQWSLGEPGGTSVSGTVRDLGWWLSGRGGADSLAPDPGDVPSLGRWR